MEKSTPPLQFTHGGSVTKVAKRRANSCVPCRISKSRVCSVVPPGSGDSGATTADQIQQCSGGIPCSTCQRKRRKPRCFYHNAISQEADDEVRSGQHDIDPSCIANETWQIFQSGSFEREQNNEDANGRSSQDPDLDNDSDDIDDERTFSGPQDSFFGDFSLSRLIDEACSSCASCRDSTNWSISSSLCGLPRGG